MACLAVGLQEGDEALVPSLTFSATANAVKYTGANPIFCDIKSIDDLTIDPKSIEEKITKNTKAILPMHYAGFPAAMHEIMDIAEKNHLYVIEDACHGPLSEYEGKKLGTIGDIGCFSFFSNKNISTGEGGMVVTNNDSFYEMMKLLRSHGMTTMSYQRASGHATNYDIKLLGYNYRIDDIRASLAIAQLKKLKEDLIKRAKVRKWYEERLLDAKGLCVPFAKHEGFVSNYIFPTVVREGDTERRDKIRDYLHEHGVQTSVHYPAVHRFSFYKKDSLALPVTEFVTDHEITLPMYSKLTESDVDYICGTYIDALGKV